MASHDQNFDMRSAYAKRALELTSEMPVNEAINVLRPLLEVACHSSGTVVEHPCAKLL